MNPASARKIFTRHRAPLHLLVTALCFLLTSPLPAAADDLPLLSLSARMRLSNSTTLGEPQPEEFDEYTLAAHFGLPWQRKVGWGVVLDSRLMASAGLMQGAGVNGLVVSLVPGLGLRHERWPVLLDLGFGGALLSRHHLGEQNFGGPFQFAVTAGVSYRCCRQFGLGFRFMHYSDAGLNGRQTVGSDFQMLELYYHF